MGGPGSGARPNPERRRLILELRAAGLSLVQIARRLGMTHQLVHYHLKAAGATRPGVVRCRACGTQVATGHPLIERNRPSLCLPCLAKCPNAPFGERLRAHRLAAGLTQAELARRSGVTEGTIGRYERVWVRPEAETLAVLVRLLGPGLTATGRNPE
jgi:DNA-binding XRE family transcriptional regulator